MTRSYDYAIFANDIYNSASGALPPGWNASLNSTATSDYYGRAYINNSTMEYIIAQRGVIIDESTSPERLQNFLQTAYNNLGAIYQTVAKTFIEEVAASLNPQGYSLAGFTGHGFGAALSVLSYQDFGSSASVFELPMPDVLGVSGVQIYNAAPNMINSLGSSIPEVTRLYPNLDGSTISSELPPSINDYALFSLQQHNMANIVNQFNPDTGLAKIYSNETAWPESITDGYNWFISYWQNPFLLDSQIYNAWSANNTGLDYESFREQAITAKLTPNGVPKTGKTIIGDDTGSAFWGGTGGGADSYQGGMGNDVYYLFDGAKTITDSGGTNTYQLPFTIKGAKSINDANPSSARMFLGESSLSGDAMLVTEFAPAVSGKRELADYFSLRGKSSERQTQATTPTYVLLPEAAKRSYIGQLDTDGSFKLGDNLAALTLGNSLTLSSFDWGSFGLTQAPNTPIIFKTPNITIWDNLPFRSYTSMINKLPDNKFVIAYFFDASSGLYIAGSEGSQAVNIPHQYPGSDMTVLSFAVMASNSQGSFIVPIIETVVSQDHFLFRMFNSAGNSICVALDIPIAYNQIITNAHGNFMLASYDVGNIDFFGNMYLYTISSTNCTILSKQFLFNAANVEFPWALQNNGNVTAIINPQQLTLDGSVNSVVRFFSSDLTLISSYSLPSLGTVFPYNAEASINGQGKLAFKYCTAFAGDTPPVGCYLYVINENGILAQRTLYYTSVNDFYLLAYLSSSKVSWMDDDSLLIMNPTGIAGSPPTGLSLDLYDSSLNLLQNIFTQPTTTPNVDSYAISTWILRQPESNSIVSAYLVPQGSNQNQLEIVTVPYETQLVLESDVILGGAGASRIDCASSTKLQCYGISQASGDVLVAAVGDSAPDTILVGGKGQQNFILKPAINALTDADEILSDADIAIWSMAPGDVIDISALPWEEANLTNSEYGSLINIPGYSPFEVSYAEGFAAYNLSLGTGGTIAPVGPFPSPSFAPSPYPSLSPSPYSSSSSSPYPSLSPSFVPQPDHIPASSSGHLSSGATAGVAVGAIAGAALLGYGGYKLFQYVKKWWHGADGVGTPVSKDVSYIVTNPIQDLGNKSSATEPKVKGTFELTNMADHQQVELAGIDAASDNSDGYAHV